MTLLNPFYLLDAALEVQVFRKRDAAMLLEARVPVTLVMLDGKKIQLNEVSIYVNMPKEVNRRLRQSGGEACVKKGGQGKPSQWLSVAGSDG